MKRKGSFSNEEQSQNKKAKVDLNFISQFPNEIKSHVLSFIGPRELLKIRLVSTDFFVFQNISNFKIGWISRNEMDELIKCYGRYQTPIGLQFLKARDLDYDSLKQISRLTQLTSLEVYPTTKAPYHLTSLISLEKLAGVDIANRGTSKLTNLTSLETNYFNRHVFPRLRQLTLHRGRITFESVGPSPHDSMLTSLKLLTCREDYPCSITNRFINRFQNLKELEYDSTYYGGSNSIQLNMHSLESLISTVEIESYAGLTNLTKLILAEMKFTEKNVHEIENLTKLKVLKIRGQLIPQNLTALPNLESFGSNSLNGVSFADVTPQKLTELELKVIPQYNRNGEDLSIIEKLTALQSLICFTPLTVNAPISGLTNLTQLKLVQNGLIPDTYKLTKLLDLTWGILADGNNIDLSHFPNLTRLSHHGYHSSVTTLTNLQSLQYILSNLDYEKFNSLAILSNLTSLTCNTGASLKGLSQLTSLKRFVGPIFNPADVADVLNLTKLTELKLMMFGQQVATKEAFSSLKQLRRITIYDQPHWNLMSEIN